MLLNCTPRVRVEGNLKAQSSLVENSQIQGHNSWLGPVPMLQLHGVHRLVTAGGIEVGQHIEPVWLRSRVRSHLMPEDRELYTKRRDCKARCPRWRTRHPFIQTMT